ncbi:MAG: methylated-DNA--[protein]-cysteine S-methyltransferase [Candidatus Nanopelagicales bacterium]
MIEVLAIKAGFISCKCTIDLNAVGFSKSGMSTEGAVAELRIIEGKVSESKPTSEFAKRVVAAIKGWAECDKDALDSVGIKIEGTKFQEDVLRSMRSIKFGSTKSYQELAVEIGRPLAFRAVASVCAKNRIPLIIPCHRVIRNDGSIGDYFYGSDLKRQLLEFESR